MVVYEKVLLIFKPRAPAEQGWALQASGNAFLHWVLLSFIAEAICDVKMEQWVIVTITDTPLPWKAYGEGKITARAWVCRKWSDCPRVVLKFVPEHQMKALRWNWDFNESKKNASQLNLQSVRDVDLLKHQCFLGTSQLHPNLCQGRNCPSAQDFIQGV